MTAPPEQRPKKGGLASGLSLLAFTSAIVGLLVLIALYFVNEGATRSASHSENEAGFEDESMWGDIRSVDPYVDWRRPEGPWRVALQAGHWRVAEVPEELENLKGNIGARGGGHEEWEVNLAIAERARDMLEDHGVIVDVLPSTIPPDHYADAFVAIHADGNPDAAVSGFKTAAPWRTWSRTADRLKALVERHYRDTTGLPVDPSVTRNMRGYYAFNWRKFEHSLHPMTPAVILETGFLTSPRDRRIIVDDQDRAARAVADAVLEFLRETVPTPKD